MPAKGGNAALDPIESGARRRLHRESVGREIQGARGTGHSRQGHRAHRRGSVQATCGKCHAEGLNGAPKIGDRAAWTKRASTGIDAAVASAIKGHGSMPSRGGMSDLTDAELKSAVQYMFSQSTGAKAGCGRSTGRRCSRNARRREARWRQGLRHGLQRLPRYGRRRCAEVRRQGGVGRSQQGGPGRLVASATRRQGRNASEGNPCERERGRAARGRRIHAGGGEVADGAATRRARMTKTGAAAPVLVSTAPRFVLLRIQLLVDEAREGLQFFLWLCVDRRPAKGRTANPRAPRLQAAESVGDEAQRG